MEVAETQLKIAVSATFGLFDSHFAVFEVF